MKIRYNIFIIIFVLFSLFVIKDDLRSIYEKGVSYFNIKSKIIISEFNNNQYVSKTSKTQIHSPGPLNVVQDLLNVNSNTNLSVLNIIEITNKNRKENGNLIPLKENYNLNISASNKVQDMFSKQYFEHISPSGVGVSDLADQSSYEYLIIGENLAMGNFKDDKSLVEAWMNSPGHRANILNKNYREIGVAVGKGLFDGKTVWVAVQHFGLNKNACPSISEVLHGVIQTTEEEINKTENELLVRRNNINKGVIYEGRTIFEQISTYNNMVAYYNEMVKDLKQKISEYNTQVEEFNNCLIQYTQ